MNKRLQNPDLESVISPISSFFQDVEVLESLSSTRDTNLSYKIRLDKKDHVLKIYNQGIREEILQNIALQRFLYAQGLPCPGIIALDGNSLFEGSNFYYSLSEFIDAEHIKNLAQEDAFRIIDFLAKFYSVSGHYPGTISPKKMRIPSIEDGPHRTESEDLSKKYKSLEVVNNDKKAVIYGDFHFDQVLKSSKGEIFLLDFESVTLGDPLEDLASFIFYSKCTGRDKMPSSRDFFDYFVDRIQCAEPDVENLKSYVKRVSLRYCLGSIWEFNKNLIVEKELVKRFKTIERAHSLEL